MEVCDASLIHELDIERILEEKYPEVAVIRNDCLNHCGLCRVRPYALVNGKRVFAKTPEECLEKIMKKIEEELAFYA